MIFFDSHVHLHFPEFDPDRAEVLKRAEEAGVRYFLNAGTTPETSEACLKMAMEHSEIYAACGIHPHEVSHATPQAMKRIEHLLEHPRAVAIGEVGLDFFRNLSPQEKQIEIFRQFVALYQKIGKPLILHCRDAYDEMRKILEEDQKSPYQGVMHCFSSNSENLKRFLDLGFYISFTGALTYKKNDVLRDACKACPLDRLLLETDAPYLAPESKRGKRNEPAMMVETAECAARIHQVSLEEIAEATTRNAKTLFRIC